MLGGLLTIYRLMIARFELDEAGESKLPLLNFPLVSKKRPTVRVGIISFICGALLGSIICLVLIQIYTTPRDDVSIVSLGCGNSTREARELGCVYDPLATHWVPEPCFDKDTLEDWKLEIGDWRGYNDTQGTQVLTLEEMSERVSPQAYFNLGRGHVIHCLYIWRRQHLASQRGGFYSEQRALTYHHTLHCMDTIIQYIDGDRKLLMEYNAGISVGFSSCLVEK
jgi:hypothetical protein